MQNYLNRMNLQEMMNYAQQVFTLRTSVLHAEIKYINDQFFIKFSFLGNTDLKCNENQVQIIFMHSQVDNFINNVHSLCKHRKIFHYFKQPVDSAMLRRVKKTEKTHLRSDSCGHGNVILCHPSPTFCVRWHCRQILRFSFFILTVSKLFVFYE